MNKNTWKCLLIAIVAISVWPAQSYAIPAFARKYETSCTTCHVVFPRLNSYGEAFRLNGYMLPEDDEGSVKDIPISLGADAYKMIWPESIWPGSIPGKSPIAFRTRFGFSYDESKDTAPTQFTVPSIQVFMGGTFSEGISFFGGVLLAQGHNTNALQMAYIRLNSLLNRFLPSQALNVRIGQFVPDLTSYKSKHNSLTQALYALNTYVPRNGSSLDLSHRNFGIAGQVIGAEASGLVTSRLRYVVGLSNGNAVFGEDNNAKDMHAKVAYKIGGMAFDGSAADEIFGPSANNWAEKSITISGFTYTGSRTDDDTLKDISIQRLGGDVIVNYRDLNVIGGFITGTDENYYVPTGGVQRVLVDRAYDLFFTEANYMIYPWLAGLMRFEQVNPHDVVGEPSFDSVSRYVIHASALYTANLRFYVESVISQGVMADRNFFIGLDYAF